MLLDRMRYKSPQPKHLCKSKNIANNKGQKRKFFVLLETLSILVGNRNFCVEKIRANFLSAKKNYKCHIWKKDKQEM